MRAKGPSGSTKVRPAARRPDRATRSAVSWAPCAAGWAVGKASDAHRSRQLREIEAAAGGACTKPLHIASLPRGSLLRRALARLLVRALRGAWPGASQTGPRALRADPYHGFLGGTAGVGVSGARRGRARAWPRSLRPPVRASRRPGVRRVRTCLRPDGPRCQGARAPRRPQAGRAAGLLQAGGVPMRFEVVRCDEAGPFDFRWWGPGEGPEHFDRSWT